MRRHLSRLVIALLFLALAPAFGADAERTLQVATRSVPPFAFQDESGRWQGIAIELWERVTGELGYKSEYRAVTLAEMIEAVAEKKVDAAVGALTITAEREEKFDFSHPFFRTGLGIAVPAESSSGFDRILRGLASPTFLATVGSLLGLLALVGAIIWLLERRHNAQFPRAVIPGIGAGLWFSSVTMTTVGYGDKAPLTFAGRSIALVWMFVSVILFSFVTASLTTALTVDALSGKVRSEDDLRRARTGTVAHSTSEARLKRKGYRHRTYGDLKAALAALAAKELDAVVYDQPLLRYYTKNDFADQLFVLPLVLEQQDYGIALPLASPLRKAVNRGLLRHGQGPEWDALVARHLGDAQP